MEKKEKGERRKRKKHRRRRRGESQEAQGDRQRRGEHRRREEESTEAEAYTVDIPSSLATNINWASTMCQALFVSVKQLLPSKRLIFC